MQSLMIRSRFTLFILSIAFLLFSAFAKAQQLSTQEQQVITKVTENNPEAIRFLEKVVNINSGTH